MGKMEKMEKMGKPHIKVMSAHGCAGHRRYKAASIDIIRAAFGKRLKLPRRISAEPMSELNFDATNEIKIYFVSGKESGRLNFI